MTEITPAKCGFSSHSMPAPMLMTASLPHLDDRCFPDMERTSLELRLCGVDHLVEVDGDGLLVAALLPLSQVGQNSLLEVPVTYAILEVPVGDVVEPLAYR